MGAIPETMMSNSNITPWHRQGTVIDRFCTGAEALELGGIDWQVVEKPIYYSAATEIPGVDEMIELDSRRLLVRGTDTQPLGVVSKSYEVVQNEWLGEIADGLGVNVQTAGQLFDGRQTFLSCDLGESPKFDGIEGIHRWLLITTRHDGSGAFQIAGVSIRPVCENTIQVAIRDGELMHSISHRTGANDRVRAAQAALQDIYVGFDAFDREIERLLDVKVGAGGVPFSTVMNSVLGRRPIEDLDNRRQVTNWDRRRRQIGHIYLSDTCDNIRGTGWGVLNAVNEWEIHHQGATKGAKRDVRTMSKTLRGNFPLTAKAQKVLVDA